jgi:WD40 repeat protein
MTPTSSIPNAHAGSIWRVDWAHPQFGQVIATCSADTYVKIYKETDGKEDGADGSAAKFVRVHDLPDSRQPVTDVKFSPKHHGLKLATCAKDGMVRIYEALDVMNLANWSLLYVSLSSFLHP